MSGQFLKIIAIIAMIIDHIGAIFFPWNLVFRYIGRLTFPIMCFLLAEGFTHTRDVRKYLSRLFFFAFISEIPYDLAFFGAFPVESSQNIFFTLAIGLICLYLIDEVIKNNKEFLAILIAVAGSVIGELLHVDYGAQGVLMIISFYLFILSEKIIFKILFISLIIAINMSLGIIQYTAILALIPIYFYNGSRGSLKLKYIFYIIYPAHLGLFYIINRVIL